MFLTKECDYAIRIVRSLANQEIKPVRLVCMDEHMPLQFAYKILKKLERANLLKSHRGAVGGYQLIKKPGDITLFDIVAAVDDSLFLSECLQEGAHCEKKVGDRCKVHEELHRLQEVLVGGLKEKFMDELV